MSAAPKRKGIKFPQWIIWEREYQFVVPLVTEECLLRLATLVKKLRPYPKILTQSHIDGINYRVLMEFAEGKDVPAYVLAYLINLNLTTTRVTLRLGFSAWMLILSLLFPSLLIALSLALHGVLQMTNSFLIQPELWIMLFILGASGMIITNFIRYLIARSNALALIKTILDVPAKPK